LYLDVFGEVKVAEVCSVCSIEDECEVTKGSDTGLIFGWQRLVGQTDCGLMKAAQQRGSLQTALAD
jgi:hypothetical protein